jgi:hypothetical protein
MTGFWKGDNANSETWTAILMMPVSFYDHFEHFQESPKAPCNGRDGAFLMEPLESNTDALPAISNEIASRIISEWTKISDYIETFVANQSTFLDEEEHDLLLFDDDTFSRSRQYFWIITAVGEFVSIIDETETLYKTLIEHLGDGLLRSSERRFLSIRERLYSQKERAAALRDGVSFTSIYYICFAADCRKAVQRQCCRRK